jgi:hypothetical protein
VSFILWLLGVILWHVSSAAGSAAAAIAAVPAPVSDVLILGIPALCAAMGGYLAPHTSRPDLVPVSYANMLVMPPTQPRTIPEPPAAQPDVPPPGGPLIV